MKRQIEIIRYLVVIALLLASVVAGLALAAPSTDPPILPTLTAPPHDWQPTPTTQWIPTVTPGPYPPPPPIVNTPAPYPPPPHPDAGGEAVYLPFVEWGAKP